MRNGKLEKRKRQVLDENCSSDDKTRENLALLPTTAFPANWWPTQASPLWTAKPRLDVTLMGPLAHPLARLHLELRGKAKDVKFALKKEDERMLMLTWGSHASQPMLYSITCTRRKSSSFLIHSFLSLSMNLSARCAFKASQGEVRGETSFHIS